MKKENKTMIIDIHCHLMPSFHTAKDRIKIMDKFHIDKTVVFLGAGGLLRLNDFVDANNFIIEATKEFPQRLIGFCIVNPLYKNEALNEVERCINQGLHGIKLLPTAQGWDTEYGFYTIDNPIMNLLVEKAIELDIPILIHTDFNAKVCTPYQLVSLARRYPKAKLIMGHMGIDPEMIRFVPNMVKDLENVYLDISTTPDMPELVITKPVKVLGSHRILFGTDGPELHPILSLKKIEVAEISEESKRNILGNNAQKLLKLDSEN
jgi:predicted TIM-barrel fold metal-dependent hydrolase